MTKLILVALSCTLMSCQGINEAKDNAATSALEGLVEGTTGQKYDAADVSNADKNSASVSFVTDELDFNNRYQDGFGSVTASKETIAITITVGESGQDNLLIGFTGKDLTTNHPIKGELNNIEGNAMSFSAMNYTNNSIASVISYELEGEIRELRHERIIIKLKGKLGKAADAGYPEKWKSFEGTLTLNYPIFQAIGNSKKDFIY